MAKKQPISRAARFLNKPTAKLPSTEQVNKTLGKLTGKEEVSEPEQKTTPTPIAKEKTSSRKSRSKKETSTPPSFPEIQYLSSKPIEPEPEAEPVKPKEKRLPLTTAITPQNRALLESAYQLGGTSVADQLNQALEHYFTYVVKVQDDDMVEFYKKRYERKAK